MHPRSHCFSAYLAILHRICDLDVPPRKLVMLVNNAALLLALPCSDRALASVLLVSRQHVTVVSVLNVVSVATIATVVTLQQIVPWNACFAHRRPLGTWCASCVLASLSRFTFIIYAQILKVRRCMGPQRCGCSLRLAHQGESSCLFETSPSCGSFCSCYVDERIDFVHMQPTSAFARHSFGYFCDG